MGRALDLPTLLHSSVPLSVLELFLLLCRTSSVTTIDLSQSALHTPTLSLLACRMSSSPSVQSPFLRLLGDSHMEMQEVLCVVCALPSLSTFGLVGCGILDSVVCLGVGVQGWHGA
jgi:hypothetical protein